MLFSDGSRLLSLWLREVYDNSDDDDDEEAVDSEGRGSSLVGDGHSARHATLRPLVRGNERCGK